MPYNSPLGYNFDGVNRIITLREAVGGVTTVNVEEIYDEAKRTFLNVAMRKEGPFPFLTTGGEELSAGVDAGAYYRLQNGSNYGWRLRPFEADADYFFVGNLTPVDSSKRVLIPTIGNFTVGVFGLQPITQNVDALLLQGQDTQYRGIVHIDQANGAAGTAHPIGLEGDPSNNLTDAIAILQRVGGNEIHWEGTLTLDQDMEGYRFVGGKAVTSNFFVFNGFSVDGSYIESGLISGVQGGTIAGFEAYKCGFQTVTSLAVGAERCTFFGNVSLKPNSQNIWINCTSGVPNNAKPQIDGTGAAELQVRGWIGGFDLRNVTNAGFVGSLDFHIGMLAVQNSCTAGSIVIGGEVYKDLLGTGGITITDKSAPRSHMIEPVEGTTTLEELVRLIASEAAGKIIQQLDGSYVIRDVNDTVDRISGDDAANGGRDITGLNVT